MSSPAQRTALAPERQEVVANASPAARVVVGLLALTAATVCGWLGTWQWDRAHVQAEQARVAAPVPLAEVIAPAADSSDALGRTVTVSGVLSANIEVVWGRELGGEPSALVVRQLTVPADQTGTGAEATLAVLVGYRAEGAAIPEVTAEAVTLTGYLRGDEAPPLEAVERRWGMDNVHETTALSTAELAQVWPSPLYSVILVAHDGSPEWQPMPAREAVARLSLQSLAYALEWWAFALFALVIAGRWIRDNSGTLKRDKGGPHG